MARSLKKDPPQAPEPPALRHDAVDQLRVPSQNMLLSMRDNVQAAAYKLLIGDDASGRVPAVVLWHALRGINARHGQPGPACIFLRGHVNASAMRIEQFREALSERIRCYKETGVFPVPCATPPSPLAFDKSHPDILIVTDAVQLGRSLKPLTDTLKDEGAGYEIATVQKTAEYPGNPYGVPIHNGKLAGTRKIYQNYELIGVHKGDPVLTGTRYPSAKQSTINAVRADARTLGEYLSEWFRHAVEEA